MATILIPEKFVKQVRHFRGKYANYYKDELKEIISKYQAGGVMGSLRYDFEEFHQGLCGVPFPDFTPILLKEIIKRINILMDHQCKYIFCHFSLYIVLKNLHIVSDSS